MTEKIKVLSYNIHKGNGFFTRLKVLPQIKNFIQQVDADIVCLQEVRDFLVKEEKLYGNSQLSYLASSDTLIVPYENYYGKNAIYKNGHHGNAILSKYPTLSSQNFDLTVSPLEYRGVLINQMDIRGKEVYVLCTHLNLRKSDRFKQIKILENIINEKIPKGSNLILVGDFNDFDNSIEKYFKTTHNFTTVEGAKTYPNVFPILSPDKIFTSNLNIDNIKVFKDFNLLKMSDHLPILTEVSLKK